MVAIFAILIEATEVMDAAIEIQAFSLLATR